MIAFACTSFPRAGYILTGLCKLCFRGPSNGKIKKTHSRTRTIFVDAFKTDASFSGAGDGGGFSEGIIYHYNSTCS